MDKRGEMKGEAQSQSGCVKQSSDELNKADAKASVVSSKKAEIDATKSNENVKKAKKVNSKSASNGLQTLPLMNRLVLSKENKRILTLAVMFLVACISFVAVGIISKFYTSIPAQMSASTANPIIELYQREMFDDANGNGVWDVGEAYTDSNNNGSYDDHLTGLNIVTTWYPGQTRDYSFVVRNYNSLDEVSDVMLNYVFKVESSHLLPLTYTVSQKQANNDVLTNTNWDEISTISSINPKSSFEVNETGLYTMNHSTKNDHYYTISITWPEGESTVESNDTNGEFIRVSIDWEQYYNSSVFTSGLITGSAFNSYVKTAKTITFDYMKDYRSDINSGDLTLVADVSANSNDSILLYKDNDTDKNYYVLSEKEIFANSCYQMFKDCTALTSITFTNFNTKNTTHMGSMFNGCSALTRLDLSSFETKNVTSMSYMFYECSVLTRVDLSSFDTSNVTRMDRMFYNCQKLASLNLSNFDTSNVTQMNHMFYNCQKLASLNLSNFDTSSVTRMDYMFYYCLKLVSIDLSNFNTSKVTNMEGMFYYCTVLSDFDVSHFDTRKVTNMGVMFCGLRAVTSLDLSNFDTRNVIYMSYMFCDCSALTNLNISSFNTSMVSDMSCMFQNCIFASIDLSNFNTSKVTTMYRMFRGCTKLVSLDLSSFRTSNVANMSEMFYSCTKLEHIYAGDLWITSAVTSSSNMFNRCTLLHNYNGSYLDKTYAYVDTDGLGYLEHSPNYTPVLVSGSTLNSQLTSLSPTKVTFDKIENGNYDTSELTWVADVSRNSNGTINLYTNPLDSTDVYILSEYSILAPVNCGTMFKDCTALTSITFTNFNTKNTTNMGNMFGSTALTSLDLTSFDTKNVTTMSNMFKDSAYLTSINLSSFDTSTVTAMQAMFYGCTRLTSLNLSNFDTSNVTLMGYMFSNCSALSSLDLTSFDTKNVTTMQEMFKGCSTLASLDLSNFNTSNVITMEQMFYNCQNLTTLDLSNFNTSNVTTMNSMFYKCTKLVNLDLSNFNTSSVTNMSSMFDNCWKLANLNVSSFNTSKVQAMSYMFRQCVVLVSVDLSSFDTSNVTNMSNMFYLSSSNQLRHIYVGDLWTTSAVTSSANMFYGCTLLHNYNGSYLDKTRAYVDTDGLGYLEWGAGYDPAQATTEVATGYYELEYIESTGTQYIDTGVTGNQNTKVEVSFSTIESVAMCMFGYQESGVGITFNLSVQSNSTRFGSWAKVGWGADMFDGQKHTVEISQQGLYQDGTLIETPTEQTFTTGNLTLFKADGAATSGSKKIYRCKIYSSNTLVRDFVGVYRASDGAVGLYDKVNGVFYENQGTGTFIRGQFV